MLQPTPISAGRGNVDDATFALAAFRGDHGRNSIREKGGLAVEEATMLQRHDVLSSGLKVDRDWWRTTKLVILAAAALSAAYVVHVTLL